MSQPARRGELRDKHGLLHSEDIFRNWSPAAIVAMGVYRVGVAGALMPRSASTPVEDDVPTTATQHQHGE